jgi:Rv0078B-related antitoxin
MSSVDGDTAARLRLAIDMAGFGLDLQRQNLRRRHPTASEQEIHELLDLWLLDRPGAPDGDCAPSVTRRR